MLTKTASLGKRSIVFFLWLLTHSAFTQTIDLSALEPELPTSYYNQDNLIIEGKSFTNLDAALQSGDNLHLYGCNNVVIRNCYFGTSFGEAISMEHVNNIIIENCFFANNRTGVYALESSGIKIRNNQFINVHGPFPRGQYVQFNKCLGEGNEVVNNVGECFAGESYPEDLVNMYQTNGTTASYIQIAGNVFRGGGPSGSGGGIMTGDWGGSYVKVDNNRVLNAGQYGIAVAGGHYIELTNNIAYNEYRPWNNIGMYVWAQAGAACSDILVANNKSWTDSPQYGLNHFWDGGNNCGAINWEANGNNSTVTVAEMNIPDQLITAVMEDELWRIREESQQFRVEVPNGDKPAWLKRPVADAAIQEAINSTALRLTAAATVGAGDNDRTYRWVQVSGPNTATIDDATSITPVVSGLVAGDYIFRLEVTDHVAMFRMIDGQAPIPKGTMPVSDAAWVTVNLETVLPIRTTNFTARVQSQNVLLSWDAIDLEPGKFLVQLSRNGNSDWITIGEVGTDIVDSKKPVISICITMPYLLELLFTIE